jgi:hypothetical protein
MGPSSRAADLRLTKRRSELPAPRGPISALTIDHLALRLRSQKGAVAASVGVSADSRRDADAPRPLPEFDGPAPLVSVDTF